MKNKVKEITEALKGVKNGDSVLLSGFGPAGMPRYLMNSLADLTDISELTLIGDDIGNDTLPAVKTLLDQNRIKKVIVTYPFLNNALTQAMLDNKIEFKIIPQGTMVERIRAYGAGLGGILTPTGVGTVVQEGKQVITVKGKDYLLEEGLGADAAFIYANKADSMGNLVIQGSARNFGVAMATAANYVIAQAMEIVPVGQIDPNDVIVPGIFIDAVVKCPRYSVKGEII